MKLSLSCLERKLVRLWALDVCLQRVGFLACAKSSLKVFFSGHILAYYPQRRGRLTEGGRKWSWRHTQGKSEAIRAVPALPGSPRPLCQRVTPWEITSEIPRSEK